MEPMLPPQAAAAAADPAGKSPKATIPVDPAKAAAAAASVPKNLVPPVLKRALPPPPPESSSSGAAAPASASDEDESSPRSDNPRRGEPTSECERLYGPYPPSVPIPHINKSGEAPPEDVLSSARTLRDLEKYPDHRDRGTPDEWIPRDGRLVRLTGRHPFNVEPPLSVLSETRFLTPASLHYVRNHGACPRLRWDEHAIEVGGAPELVPGPYEITMDELVAMPNPREFPCTLVCAGNRRKEQNMMRQTVGFNWGPSGASTNVWKGVLLRDLLLRAGVSPKNMRGKHVEFLGVEDLPNKVGPGPFKDEPWGKTVKYGTSVPLARAMNPAYDIIVAYQANGEPLQPDHGYPVRLIIPGYIGGRMIKWLEKINVLKHETRNHYHYHDNRILPPHITAEESLRGDWWYRPEYIFNELNINSVISRPDHNETLSIARNINGTYEVAGYAYTGGGRRITRVELSADRGVHWRLCSVDRTERPTDHGMHWCWVWWKFDLKVVDLVGCGEILCRAWDEANNVQPSEPTWNLMGMGNNQVFRVKVHMDKADNGEHVFRFEHPTQPGQQKGGWMTRAATKPESAGFGRLLEERAKAEAIATAVTPAPKVKVPGAKAAKPGGKVYTMTEVAKHNAKSDVWIVVNNKVYDCADYLELHPGGKDSILINAGSDATEDFVAIHSAKATETLEKYYIGDLDTTASTSAAAGANPAGAEADADGGAPVTLDPRRRISLPLRSKTVLSRDSFLLTFALPSPRHVLGLPTGKHLFLSATIDGERVMRRYTPVTSDHDRGCVKFVVKAYRPCERFPRGGKMSQHLDSLAPGKDAVDVRGPVGEFEYLGGGSFLVEGRERSAAKFNMIAGGTGITPCVQIAAEILRRPEDDTQMSLVFAAREEGDLLLRGVLDEWAAKFPSKFRVHYVLSDAWPKDWKYSTGFVDKDLFEKCLHPAGEDVWNLMCGPPVMLERGCGPNLEKLGHDGGRMFSF